MSFFQKLSSVGRLFGLSSDGTEEIELMLQKKVNVVIDRAANVRGSKRLLTVINEFSNEEEFAKKEEELLQFYRKSYCNTVKNEIKPVFCCSTRNCPKMS